MFQAQNREIINSRAYLKSCCVHRDYYDDEHDKTVFHKTTPDVQDQDRSVQDQDQLPTPIFWSQTGVVLRPMVSDHITGPTSIGEWKYSQQLLQRSYTTFLSGLRKLGGG